MNVLQTLNADDLLNEHKAFKAGPLIASLSGTKEKHEKHGTKEKHNITVKSLLGKFDC